MVRYGEDLKPVFKVMAGEKGELLNLDEEVGVKVIQIYCGRNNYIA